MPVITLSVPEETLAKYAGDLKQDKRINDRLVSQLKRFEDVKVEDRIAVILPEARRKIEAITGYEIVDGESVLKFIARAGELKMGDATVELSPAQRNALVAQQKFVNPNLTPDEYLSKLVKTALGNVLGV
jgi:hypothetical protein